jgi:hypothetical protein
MKRFMSKGCIVAVCLGLAMAFSGCGNSAETPADNAPAQEEVQDSQPEDQNAIGEEENGEADADVVTDGAEEGEVNVDEATDAPAPEAPADETPAE